MKFQCLDTTLNGCLGPFPHDREEHSSSFLRTVVLPPSPFPSSPHFRGTSACSSFDSSCLLLATSARISSITWGIENNKLSFERVIAITIARVITIVMAISAIPNGIPPSPELTGEAA